MIPSRCAEPAVWAVAKWHRDDSSSRHAHCLRDRGSGGRLRDVLDFGSTPTTIKVIKDFDALASLSGPLSLVTTDQPPYGDGTVQLVRRVGTHELAVGPPLASFQWNSGTHPVVAKGPGVLWLFELGASDPPLDAPPTVWRISDASGAVLQKTIVPGFSAAVTRSRCEWTLSRCGQCIWRERRRHTHLSRRHTGTSGFHDDANKEKPSCRCTIRGKYVSNAG